MAMTCYELPIPPISQFSVPLPFNFLFDCLLELTLDSPFIHNLQDEIYPSKHNVSCIELDPVCLQIIFSPFFPLKDAIRLCRNQKMFLIKSSQLYFQSANLHQGFLMILFMYSAFTLYFLIHCNLHLSALTQRVTEGRREGIKEGRKTQMHSNTIITAQENVRRVIISSFQLLQLVIV